MAVNRFLMRRFPGAVADAGSRYLSGVEQGMSATAAVAYSRPNTVDAWHDPDQ
jgi:hypothetical protein